MSYILDALRRADNERASEGSPTLHDHKPEALPIEALEGRAKAPWLWMAAGAGLALVVALLTLLLLRTPREAAEPPAPQTAAARPEAAPSSAPAELALATPLPTPAAALSTAATPPAATLPLPQPVPTPTPAGSQEPVSAPAANSEVPLLRLEQLPDSMRNSLPPMNVDGTVYSTDPASRMLMINGRLLREGEAFTAEISVEEIKAKSAVMRYRGIRFEIGK